LIKKKRDPETPVTAAELIGTIMFRVFGLTGTCPLSNEKKGS
jgi:hypothetical protein